LSLEPKLVADYWTTPCWKHNWNGGYSTGTEVVEGLSGNPYLRSLLDLEIKIKGAKPDALAAMFYRSDVAPKPLPDLYTVYDRNLVGVRARYGNFSYAITTRPTAANEPGKDTLAGAMVLDDNPKEPYPLIAALMLATPQVYLQAGSNKPQDIAYCTRDDVSGVVTGKGYSAVSSHYALQTFGSSSRGKDAPWGADQEWICVQDRMFGLLEVAPLAGTGTAAAVTSHLLFGTGGTAGGPRQEMKTVDDHHYTYGKLAIAVDDFNFAALKVVSTKVRITPAAELVFQDDMATADLPGSSMRTCSANKPFYCVVDIHPDTVTAVAMAQRVVQPSGCTGLRVQMGNKLFVLWRNRSDQPVSLDLSGSVLPATKATLHFGHEPKRPAQSPAPSSISLAAQSEVLVVSSRDDIDHEDGWENYPAMVGQSP
jgi:hypothetical protein